jgi:hypothetical protein
MKWKMGVDLKMQELDHNVPNDNLNIAVSNLGSCIRMLANF